MTPFSARSIVLWKKEYGENDILISFFSEGYGKITAIAKNAKKSVKRFGGVLELFSLIEAVFRPSKNGGLFVLSEASLEKPFEGIRTDFEKTAHAGYWSEVLSCSMEEGHGQDDIFHLFLEVLENMAEGRLPAETLGIIFQIKLLQLSGLSPDFSSCSGCGEPVDSVKCRSFFFDVRGGRLICKECFKGPAAGNNFKISRGTINELRWIQNNTCSMSLRLRLNNGSLIESRKLLERFLPFHIGKEIKSLRLLDRLRMDS